MPLAMIHFISGEHPGHDLPEPGRPVDPGFGGGVPVPPKPWPPLPPDASNKPIELPPDTIWPGVPVFPVTPSHPIALPPGSIWPPLPPSVPPGKAIALIAISGVGWRWAVIEIPQPKK
jgi:hypothetical protein